MSLVNVVLVMCLTRTFVPPYQPHYYLHCCGGGDILTGDMNVRLVEK